MNFGQRLRQYREERGFSRKALAHQLDVTSSAIGNYETGVSFPKEDVLLRIFDVLQVEPNALYQDSFQSGAAVLTQSEQELLQRYRTLDTQGRQSVQGVVTALWESRPGRASARRIPLYSSLAATGMATPGQDVSFIPVDETVPDQAEFAVRIPEDSMAPVIARDSVVYVNRAPLQSGDVGIFCVDGEVMCRQYHKDALGTVHLFVVNRTCKAGDEVVDAHSRRMLACFGRVMMPTLALVVTKEDV